MISRIGLTLFLSAALASTAAAQGRGNNDRDTIPKGFRPPPGDVPHLARQRAARPAAGTDRLRDRGPQPSA